ncbi:hypothetical protein GH714_001694 [Hevea brasiliensis]|uniref:2-(3-amino-3-carboxypropyl)histidine synthase subunit 1 n=1 Tax=Hevea brasiliensis TaxID=3981 RepID=A0A6A6M9Y4_HEVBR|nr:hypothetical protein GH714_001694 [Hevea brasiliensis]
MLGASVHQELEQQMPSSDIPSKILWQVIKIDLQDMQQQTPCQQLIAKDLHGNEWNFQHVNQTITQHQHRSLYLQSMATLDETSAETFRQKPNPRNYPQRLISQCRISLLPSNYNLEVHKCVWRIRSTRAKRLALQLPEGLLLYSLILSDIFTAFAGVTHYFVLGDVTYGACCVDDLSALALGADLLIHYGHSCLVPIDATKVPCLYVFVDIKIDVERLISTIKLNLNDKKSIVLAGTIQFASAIREAKPELEKLGLSVLIP